MSALATPPLDVKPLPTQDLKPTLEHLTNGNSNGTSSGAPATGSRPRDSSGSLSPAPASMPVAIKSEIGLVKHEPIDVDDDEDKPLVKAEDDKVKVEEHKRRYDEEEKKLRDLEPPPVQRVQDEYVHLRSWANWQLASRVCVGFYRQVQSER